MPLRMFAALGETSHGHVSNILTGRRRPPLDKVAMWAELLGIDGEEREEFVRQAELMHTPAGVLAEYLRMRAERGR